MPTAETPTPPSFEQALDQLEKIVDSMEAGDIPLEDLLAKYETGTQLLKVCEGRLKEAELRIELLKKQGPSGAPVSTRFEADQDD